jgi:hypothetical protein
MYVQCRISSWLIFFSLINFYSCKMNRINSADLPKNLTIIISGGSLVPGELNSTIIISMDSISSCSKYDPSDPMADLPKIYQFELTNIQKVKIRKAVVNNSFFTLENNYTNPNVLDGFFIDITISKTNQSHMVRVQNYDQVNVKKIIETINTCLPMEYRFKW